VQKKEDKNPKDKAKTQPPASKDDANNPPGVLMPPEKEMSPPQMG